MPEDTQERPSTHGIVKNQSLTLGSVPDITTERRGFTHEISWNTVVDASKQAVVELKAKYPNISAAQIDSVANLVFGPFRMDRKNMGEITDTKGKVESARIQHNLVHGLLYAGTKDAGPAYSDTIYNVALVMEKLANSTPGELNGLRAYWGGVKNELAIVKALIKAEYSVELPDYNQGPDTPDDQNELLNWDVLNGIDLVAYKPNEKLLLIDAKGRRRFQAGYVRTVVHVNESPIGMVPQNIRDKYPPNFQKGEVSKLEVVIPSDPQFLNPLKPLDENTKARQALDYFARSRFESDIIQRVKSPTRFQK